MMLGFVVRKVNFEKENITFIFKNYIDNNSLFYIKVTINITITPQEDEEQQYHTFYLYSPLRRRQIKQNKLVYSN